jgi:hypothetical protein
MPPVHAIRRLLLPSILATALAACGHVPVRSMLAMSRIDFATTDLSAMRAALRIPNAYQARANRMVVEVMQEGRPAIREEFALERLTSTAELSLLGSERRTGTEIIAYRLPDAAIATFTALRAKAAEAKAEKRKGSLTLKLEPDFCYVSEPPKDSLVFSTYLRTSETRTYVPVLIDLDGFSQKDFAD